MEQQKEQQEQNNSETLNQIKGNLKRQISILTDIAIKIDEDNNRLLNKRRKINKNVNIRQQ